MLSKSKLQDGQFPIPLEGAKFLQMNIARNASGDAEYVGWAAPGTPEDATGWLISKYTYTDGNVDKNRLADDSVAFDKTWDDRAEYSYS